MEKRKPQYIDVILPLSLQDCLTYAVPITWDTEVQSGCRVVVPLGKRKCYTAIVLKVHEVAPEDYKVKEAIELLDIFPIVLPAQLELWQWMSRYYLCTLGEVYKAALPSGMKMESETLVTADPQFSYEKPLSRSEQRVMDVLTTVTEIRLSKLSKEVGVLNLFPIVQNMMEKGAVMCKETLRQTYHQKCEVRIRLQEAYATEEALNTLLEHLGKRAPKQRDLLLAYLDLSCCMEREISPKEVSKLALLRYAQSSASVLEGLFKKKILTSYAVDIGHFTQRKGDLFALSPLNDAQQKAKQALDKLYVQKEVCLLYGVTSSGKTEVYMHLIAEQLKQGKQVLYLLPEIALTTQITQRLHRVFGDKLGVYHSRLSDAERVDIWRKQLSDNPYQILLGVRSSVFLPFQHLGLVIVDEEHEASFKQQSPAPRYHGRNVALVLAAEQKAKVLLGTATPSIESAWFAAHGKYGLVQLKERYQSIKLPEIIPVDVKELLRKKRMKGYLSPLLLESMREALAQKEQVILFQNRRGFAPMVECKLCGWVPRCVNCDVSLTYHKGLRMLTCHYCGYTEPIPKCCPSCHNEELLERGFGTEKVQEDIERLFPEVKVARMDTDTTRSRLSYERVINDFQSGRTQILIGTQMVSKGLDFDHVSVVGILNADAMLNYPDFRSYERAFQLMAQVSGRAGRKHKQGKVILQTKVIDHPIIQQVMDNNFSALYQMQLAERKLFRYPPFYRLVYLYVKGKDAARTEEMAQVMAQRLRGVFGERILGPDNPPVARIQLMYIKKIMIKLEITLSPTQARERLWQIQQAIAGETRFKGMQVYYDVDPM